MPITDHAHPLPMDKLIDLLNHRLLGIFQGKIRNDLAAYEEYYRLLLLETAFLLYTYGVEEEKCPGEAKTLLRLILRQVTLAEMEDIEKEGAFVWWKKRLRDILVPNLVAE